MNNNGSNSSLYKEDKVLQEQASFEFSGSCSLEKRAEISDIYGKAPVGSRFVYEVESTDGKIGTVEFIKGKRALEYDSHSGEVNFDENQKEQFFVGFENNDKETAYLYGDMEKKIKKVSVYIPKDNENLSEIAEDVTGNINNILEREKSVLRGFSKNKERVRSRFERLLDLSHMKVVNETSNSLKTLEGLQVGEAIIIDGTNLAWLHLGNGEYIKGEISFEGKLFKGTNQGGEKQSRTEVYNEIVEYYNKRDSELTGGKYNDAGSLVSRREEIKKLFDLEKEKTEETPEGKTEETPEGKTEETPEGKTEETPEGKTEETPEGKTEETPEGKTEETPEGKTEEAPEGKTEETPEGKIEETPEGKIEETPEGKTEETPEKKPNIGLIGKVKSKFLNYLGRLKSKLRGFIKRNKKKKQ